MWVKKDCEDNRVAVEYDLKWGSGKMKEERRCKCPVWRDVGFTAVLPALLLLLLCLSLSPSGNGKGEDGLGTTA